MITLLGLGPGNPKHLTQEAVQLLESISEIHLRTIQHPAIAGFPSSLKFIALMIFTPSPSFEYVYAQIVDRVLELARRHQGVVHAVPGHPLVAEATCPGSYAKCSHGISVRIVDGLAFRTNIFCLCDPCLTGNSRCLE
jgi:tetrapyrrole methylase family protein/MazG family protein